MTLAMQDRKSEAETAYHQLLIIKPGLAAGLSGLANVLLSQGRSLEAAQLFIKAVESDPRNTECLNGWAAALAQQNQLSSAVAKYSESLKIDPNQPVVHCAIADLATGLGETEKSVHHYREALRLEPAMGLALNNLAWILATHPDAHYRDGKEAVRLSQLACKQTDYKLPFLIGTLAAAQAEAGEFEAAIASAEMARDLAISNGQPEVAKKNEELLVLYRSGRAYRESSRGH
ncbi:MAG TPA: tetratricopeptide repeat protein [Clostridia bacterium]|nr:tetratricopeptide repeat protein [Clostridia bacterium]